MFQIPAWQTSNHLCFLSYVLAHIACLDQQKKLETWSLRVRSVFFLPSICRCAILHLHFALSYILIYSCPYTYIFNELRRQGMFYYVFLGQRSVICVPQTRRPGLGTTRNILCQRTTEYVRNVYPCIFCRRFS